MTGSAKQSRGLPREAWIASSLALLAMTVPILAGDFGMALKLFELVGTDEAFSQGTGADAADLENTSLSRR
jgi:hypothetical protein